jgi:hypothetical protein
MIGQMFSRLTVVESAGVNIHQKKLWKCACACGAFAVVTTGSLNSGNTTSCGCYKNERQRSSRTGKHHDKGSSEYTCWCRMRARCFNENTHSYALYGGRGITVCQRWMEYANFLADMGRKPTKRHSIDRIDVNGNYEPGNCRWATPSQQLRNTRVNRMVEFNGELRPLVEWCEILNLNYYRTHNRLSRGLSVERCFYPRRLYRT